MVNETNENIKPKLTTNTTWIWVVLITLLLLNHFAGGLEKRISYDELIKSIQAGKVTEILFDNEEIKATMKIPKTPAANVAKTAPKSINQGNVETVTTYAVKDEALIPLLKEKNIKFQASPPKTAWGSLFIWFLPLLIFYFFMRNSLKFMGGSGNPLLSLNKSKAKVYVEKDIKTTFADVAGVDEAKDELVEIVNFLKDPTKYSRLGGHVPKGILLVGPPGTGKTLMAKAVAGEANVPFFSINGSEFVELFVGMGAARVRDLFQQARDQSPCIVFIDELDALGKARAISGVTGGHDEKEQTLNQLLAELDGFDSTSGVILIGATNRPEVLDPALLRAGRFDRQVLLDKPDKKGRVEILKIHIKNIKVHEDVKLDEVAALTPGFSGADLSNLINEAALTATRRNAELVEIKDFLQAVERVVAGLERRQRIMNTEEKERVAIHEMGHATVALSLETKDKVQKVSIIPRGIGALGYTLQRPLEDRYIMTKIELENKIATLLSGRVSEQVFVGDLSTAAGDDLIKASNLARAMITQYGMGDALGLVSEEVNQSRFLQMDYPMGYHKTWSDKTEELIDQETKFILDKCHELSQKIIELNSDFIHTCVKELLRKETLEAEEIESFWKEHGKSFKREASPSFAKENLGPDSHASL
jgi:cell division protease FtsH